MRKAEDYIDALGLIAHPEGGHYKQTYIHDVALLSDAVGGHYEGTRPLSTSIYFLLMNEEVSHLHRLESDEIWYFHEGEPLCVVTFNEGVIKEHILGLNIEQGESPQLLVPAGTIFGSYIPSKKGYTLVSCMVSIGFDFRDFELIKAADLIADYPEHTEFIKHMCIE